MIAKPQPWSLEFCRLSPEAQELWRSCVLAFPLWGSGERYAWDQSPYGLHGTFGAGLLSTDWAGSPYGPALTFGGAGTDVITVADPATSWLDNTDKLSAEIVFRPTGTGGLTGKHGLLNKYRTVAGERAWRWYTNGTELELQISSDGTAYEIQVTSGAGLSLDTWYHAGFSFKEGVFRTYLQGKQVTVDDDFAATSIFGSPQNLLVGQRLTDAGAPAETFTGQIAGVRIWERQLSDWEFQRLYEAPWSMYSAEPWSPYCGPGLAVLHSGGAGPGPWWDAGVVQKGVQELLIPGLENGVKYDVQAFTRDTSGNVSSGSSVEDATPAGTGSVWAGTRRIMVAAPAAPGLRRRLRR